uniref:Uncharacterized protein n=1 Tax=uncultured marine virus TaxID=186617 RepID=A0A0F7L5F3_9VIRU|nr:hypothetical protein [uncultured marine virus]
MFVNQQVDHLQVVNHPMSNHQVMVVQNLCKVVEMDLLEYLKLDSVILQNLDNQSKHLDIG